MPCLKKPQLVRQLIPLPEYKFGALAVVHSLSLGARSRAHMAPLLDLVCFGGECVTWADAYARGRHGWVESLPSMVTDTNAICRIQGQLLCSDVAPGAVCAPFGQQRCSDLLELRPGFAGGPSPTSSGLANGRHQSPRSACDPRLGRNRGSVLSVHLAWPPPKPPPSALLQVALRFMTVSHKHRMNWVPVLLQEVAAQGVPRLAGVPCSSARLEDGAIFRSFFTGEREATQTGTRGTRLAMILYFQKLRHGMCATPRRLRWAAIGRGWDLPRDWRVRRSKRVDDRLLRAVPRLAGHSRRGSAAVIQDAAGKPALHPQHSGRHLPSARIRAILWRCEIVLAHRWQRLRRRLRASTDNG